MHAHLQNKIFSYFLRFGNVTFPDATAKIQMTGKNIGDLLNAKNISWGWFSSGFSPTPNNSNLEKEIVVQIDMIMVME